MDVRVALSCMLYSIEFGPFVALWGVGADCWILGLPAPIRRSEFRRTSS